MRYGAAVFGRAMDGGALAQAGRFSTPWGKSGGKTRLSTIPQGRPSSFPPPVFFSPGRPWLPPRRPPRRIRRPLSPRRPPRRVRRPQAAKKGEMGFSRGHTPGWLLLPLRGNSPSAPREKHFSPKAGRLFPKGIEVRLGCFPSKKRQSAFSNVKKGRAENSARPFGLYSVTKGSRAI